MTAYTMKGDRERFLEAGFDGYVRKPISVEELFEAIDAVVPPAQARPAPRGGAARSSRSSPPRGRALGAPCRPTRPRSTGRRRWSGSRATRGSCASWSRSSCESASVDGAIRAAVAGRDAPTLKRAAHTLKGAVDSFGGAAAHAAALELERAGREADLARAEEALARLEGEIARLLPELRAFFAA